MLVAFEGDLPIRLVNAGRRTFRQRGGAQQTHAQSKSLLSDIGHISAPDAVDLRVGGPDFDLSRKFSEL